jgi:hypothetical protein
MGLMLLASAGSPCAIPNLHANEASGSEAPVNPPAKVPAGVILVKGAWSSASDSTTPLPERGAVTPQGYTNPYFHLSYPITPGWIQQYEGPPPSDSGYYVLAQIQPPDLQKTTANGPRGTVLIAAQDMFFSATPAKGALELLTYTGSRLRADYVVERQPEQVIIAGHSFARLDYVSPAASLHWTILATQIRCHTVQVTLTSPDPTVIKQLVGEMSAMKLPPEAGLSSGSGGDGAPVCIRDYINSGRVLNRVEPLLTGHHYNPIPVRVIIDVHGRVKHIHFISSFPEQARVISDALQQWRFKPYVINRVPVEVETGLLFGTAPKRALISGRQDPQLVPARRKAPT